MTNMTVLVIVVIVQWFAMLFMLTAGVNAERKDPMGSTRQIAVAVVLMLGCWVALAWRLR